VRPADGVQPRLLVARVLARAGDAEAEPVAVEGEAPGGVGDGDRGVIDAQEERVTMLLPARITLARREPDQLERVPVGIAEVEGTDAARRRVPVG
jgi:hypothetical protein